MSAFHSALESLGLSTKEIDAYLLLLQMGTSAASVLGRRLKIPPSTAQYTCQQLVKKGLVRMVQRSNTYLFSAEPPRRLMALVAEQRTAIEAKEKMLEQTVVDLEKVMNPNPVLPKVRFFEGDEGVIDAFEEFMEDLEENTERLCYVQPVDLSSNPGRLKGVLEKLAKKCVAKGVSSRVIIPLSQQALRYHADEKKYDEEHRFVADDTFQCMPTEVILYKDKMYCMTSHDNFVFATIIQNTGIVSMQKSIFEMAWKQAKLSHDEIMQSRVKKPAKKK